MIRRALLLALFWGGGARAQSPVTVRLDDAGPGAGPAFLARALAAPHTVVGPGSTPALLSRDSTFRRTVIVLGRDATVEGSVTGDVIVIAGDLHIRPGAPVSGRAVAIGGGVYESALAHVSRGAVVYRDFTYDIAPTPGGFALRYRSLVEAPTPTWFGLASSASGSRATTARTGSLFPSHRASRFQRPSSSSSHASPTARSGASSSHRARSSTLSTAGPPSESPREGAPSATRIGFGTT